MIKKLHLLKVLAFRNKKGYTLLEVLAAVAILGIGLSALMPMMISQLRTNDGGEMRTRGLAFAQDVAERIIRQPAFDSVPDSGSEPNPEYPEYSIDWALDKSLSANLKRFRVDVSWAAVGGRNSSVCLYVSKSSDQ